MLGLAFSSASEVLGDRLEVLRTPPGIRIHPNQSLNRRASFPDVGFQAPDPGPETASSGGIWSDAALQPPAHWSVRRRPQNSSALDRLAVGSPWSLQIIGEPGIGKSRLLAELHLRAYAATSSQGPRRLNSVDVPFGVLLRAFNDRLARASVPPVLGPGRRVSRSLSPAAVGARSPHRGCRRRYRIHRDPRHSSAWPSDAGGDTRRRAVGRHGVGRDDLPCDPRFRGPVMGALSVPPAARRPARRSMR
jgi:hypothetical protein